jgi:hypothetical protein
MSKTAVGLFENPSVADQVVTDLDACAFPQNEIRVLSEPLDMAVAGVTSIPHVDFEVGLGRELQAIGANVQEANAYIQGVRHGKVLVFATGSNQEVDNAAEIMNRHGAIKLEELIGREPVNGGLPANYLPAAHNDSLQTGRIRQSGDGVRMFVW